MKANAVHNAVSIDRIFKCVVMLTSQQQTCPIYHVRALHHILQAQIKRSHVRECLPPTILLSATYSNTNPEKQVLCAVVCQVQCVIIHVNLEQNKTHSVAFHMHDDAL